MTEIIAVALVAIFIVAITLTKKSKSKEPSIDIYKMRDLLSPAERSFYGVLKQAVNENYEIFTKVRLADILAPANATQRKSALNKIIAKHIDFVICDSSTLQIKIAIELDDKTHQRNDRKTRDEFVSKICKEAGLPLINIRASHAYKIEEIRKAISEISK